VLSTWSRIQPMAVSVVAGRATVRVAGPAGVPPQPFVFFSEASRVR